MTSNDTPNKANSFLVVYASKLEQEYQDACQTLEEFCNQHFGSTWEVARMNGASVTMNGEETTPPYVPATTLEQAFNINKPAEAARLAEPEEVARIAEAARAAEASRIVEESLRFEEDKLAKAKAEADKTNESQ